MVAKIAARWHDVTDAAWRVLERAHDAAEDLRDHHLFPNRKVFNGAVVTGIGYGIRALLQSTGVDLGPILGPEVPAIAGIITSYVFTDGPAVHMEDAADGEALGAEETATRTAAARGVAAATTASSHSAVPPRND